MHAELPNLVRRAAWSSSRASRCIRPRWPSTHLLTSVFWNFLNKRLVPDDQPRLDQRGLGLHVGVGHLDAILEAAHRVADLQPDVPKRIQNAVNDLGQMRQRPAPGRNLPVVQEHEINVAVRIQLRAPVAADGHQRQRRKFLSRLLGQSALGRVPQVAQQQIDDGRPRRGRLRGRPRRRGGAV